MDFKVGDAVIANTEWIISRQVRCNDTGKRNIVGIVVEVAKIPGQYLQRFGTDMVFVEYEWNGQKVMSGWMPDCLVHIDRPLTRIERIIYGL